MLRPGGVRGTVFVALRLENDGEVVRSIHRPSNQEHCHGTATPADARGLSIRNFAENTQLASARQVSAFSRHFDRSPEELGPEQARAYQTHLVMDGHLTERSVGIATSALPFLCTE